MAALPAIFRLSPGREVVLYDFSGNALAGAATNTPSARTWRAHDFTVAANDWIDRGSIRTLAVYALTDNGAGTVKIEWANANGTTAAGTALGTVMGAGTAYSQNVTIAPYPRFRVSLNNGGTVTAAHQLTVRGYA